MEEQQEHEQANLSDDDAQQQPQQLFPFLITYFGMIILLWSGTP